MKNKVTYKIKGKKCSIIKVFLYLGIFHFTFYSINTWDTCTENYAVSCNFRAQMCCVTVTPHPLLFPHSLNLFTVGVKIKNKTIHKVQSYVNLVNHSGDVWPFRPCHSDERAHSLSFTMVKKLNSLVASTAVTVVAAIFSQIVKGEGGSLSCFYSYIVVFKGSAHPKYEISSLVVSCHAGHFNLYAHF